MTSDLFTARFPEPGVVVYVEGFDMKVARIRDLLQRVNRHRNRIKYCRQIRDQGQRTITEMGELRDALAAGKTVLAFDCEWHRVTQVTHEIGYTLYGNDIKQSYNLRFSHQANGAFDFGRTEFVSRQEGYARFMKACAQADYYVGHALKNDFAHLRSHGVEVPRKPYFDTLWWGNALIGRVAKLSVLAAHYDVPCPNPHCGGNDARYTLDIMLKMAA